MPDLTIKPNAGSGNKVIIQDQAGGSVLTTADSGATIVNATLTTPIISTGSAPGSPTEGQFYYNTYTNTFNFYNGVAWEQITTGAHGGIVTTYESGGSRYVVHKFLHTGIFTPLTNITAEWLIVAGGGGSGYGQVSSEAGSGGGAGGFRTGTTMSFTANENYLMTVGYGGGGADYHQSTNTTRGRGGNSSIQGPGIFPVICEGGGGGVKYGQEGADGGSGSGGSDSGGHNGGKPFPIEQMNAGSGNKAHGETTTVQGWVGGSSSVNSSSGGGGGASAAGQAAQSGAGGYGGAGAASDIVLKGTNVTYAGGGGGGHSSTGGAGGAGGGGAGGGGGNNWGIPGAPFTGGGAGGPWTTNAERMGSQGGSGIVVIRYTI